MKTYRIELIGPGSQRKHLDTITSATDLDALDKACAIVTDADFELWQGDRLILAVERSKSKKT